MDVLVEIPKHLQDMAARLTRLAEAAAIPGPSAYRMEIRYDEDPELPGMPCIIVELSKSSDDKPFSIYRFNSQGMCQYSPGDALLPAHRVINMMRQALAQHVRAESGLTDLAAMIEILITGDKRLEGQDLPDRVLAVRRATQKIDL